MAEFEIYDLKGNFLGKEEFSKFYSKSKEEYDRYGKVSRQIKIMRCLLLTSNGEILIHKRSLNVQNPGLLDKSIGGHVEIGDSFEETLIKEGEEELGVKINVIENIDLIKNFDLLKNAICFKIDTINGFLSKRTLKDGSSFYQPNITEIFLGYYDGSFSFNDAECLEIIKIGKKELLEELKKNPDKFTEDIKHIIKNYQDRIKCLNS